MYEANSRCRTVQREVSIHVVKLAASGGWRSPFGLTDRFVRQPEALLLATILGIMVALVSSSGLRPPQLLRVAGILGFGSALTMVW